MEYVVTTSSIMVEFEATDVTIKMRGAGSACDLQLAGQAPDGVLGVVRRFNLALGLVGVGVKDLTMFNPSAGGSHRFRITVEALPSAEPEKKGP